MQQSNMHVFDVFKNWCGPVEEVEVMRAISLGSVG